MKIINWGIISTGNIAHSFANEFSFTHGGKILAVASRSITKAHAFARKFKVDRAYGTYDGLLNDPDIDVIYIATPHNFHFQLASSAMKIGKAVLCEKPLTVNPDECKELMEISGKTNSYLMEAMWTYFLPPIRKAKKWIDEGKIGKVRQLKADFGFKATYDPENRVFNPELAGGALLDIGIYPIALAWLVFNQFPADVSVTCDIAPTGVDQEENMVFNYSNGVSAHLTSTFCRKLPNEAIITGEFGFIRIPDFFMARESFLYVDDRINEHFKDKRKAVGYNFEIEAVQSDLVNKKTQSEIMPLETSLKLQELMDLVRKKFNT